MTQVNTMQPIALSDIAKKNSDTLREAGVLAVSIVGGPGCGKTTLINATVDRLSPRASVAVISCDLSSHRDVGQISKHSDHVLHVNIGEGGKLEPEHLRDALLELNLNELDLLIIENVGTLNLREPPQLGQHRSVTMFSVAAGDDKPQKHPELVRSADAVVLSKTDLLDAVPFNVQSFREDVRRLNSGIEIIEVSALRGSGLEQWINWLNPKTDRDRGNLSHWFG